MSNSVNGKMEKYWSIYCSRFWPDLLLWSVPLMLFMIIYSKNKFFFAHSELNDTIVEAQLRTRQVPPLLPNKVAVDCYSKSNNRLIILVSCLLDHQTLNKGLSLIIHPILCNKYYAYIYKWKPTSPYIYKCTACF